MSERAGDEGTYPLRTRASKSLEVPPKAILAPACLKKRSAARYCRSQAPREHVCCSGGASRAARPRAKLVSHRISVKLVRRTGQLIGLRITTEKRIESRWRDKSILECRADSKPYNCVYRFLFPMCIEHDRTGTGTGSGSGTGSETGSESCMSSNIEEDSLGDRTRTLTRYPGLDRCRGSIGRTGAQILSGIRERSRGNSSREHPDADCQLSLDPVQCCKRLWSMRLLAFAETSILS